MARLIPVVDVMGGRVVRAVGGRRSEYQPLVSRLTDSTDPAVVARTLVECAQANILYVAELDAITGNGLAAPLDLGACRAEVWLDRGVRTFDDLDRWPSGADGFPVLGSETVREPQRLARSLFVQGCTGVVSVDLKDGGMLGDWRRGVEVSERATTYVDAFASVGCCRAVVVLDLSSVGESRGPSELLLYVLDQLRTDWQELEITVGGGVRNQSDVQGLLDAGADAVLVASALHDGALP